MDELKLILGTKLMRGIVTKIITKAIYKKTKCLVDIELHEITAKVVDGKVQFHANVGAEMTVDDLIKIIKSNDLI